MKYGVAAITVIVVAAVGMTFIAISTAEDDMPNVLTGTEITIEDWETCLAEVNADRERFGAEPLKELPVLKEDGQWHFSGQVGGAIYSCGTFPGEGHVSSMICGHTMDAMWPSM
jgi:hypothetical protein